MYFVILSDEEHFYFKMLLIAVQESRSFKDLQMINEMIYSNFKSVYIAQKLLNSNEQWYQYLKKVAL